MPEFELDLRNVESEVVDGVTVVKSAEVTAVSLAGGSVAPGAAERITAWAQPVSAEEAAANLHANAAAFARSAREGDRG